MNEVLNTTPSFAGRICMVLILTSMILASGCRKFLDTEISTDLTTSETVFKDEQTATSAVLGVYSRLLSTPGSFANGDFASVTALCGLAADELVNFPRTDPNIASVDENQLQSSNPNVLANWGGLYNTIYQANSIIEGLERSTALNDGFKKQLSGEAKFIRAFAYFYLTNLYGDVPLALTTDRIKNASLSRSPTAEVMQQIIIDLNDAKNNLQPNYLDGSNNVSIERIRANAWAAIALLARVYLYNGDWANAEAVSSLIISNTSTHKLTTSLDSVFLKNNSEAIWQLKPLSSPNGATQEAIFFSQNVILQHHVLRSSLSTAFEPGDNRATMWVKSFNPSGTPIYRPSKYNQGLTYQPVTEYSVVLRLAEQYLIRAEARARLGKITGANSASSDINIIRQRAGLGNTSANTQSQMLAAIEHERKVELFTEWGHRWFDLKRWNRADAVLAPLKGAGWQSTDVLYPIPQNEIDKNPQLKPQNPGY